MEAVPPRLLPVIVGLNFKLMQVEMPVDKAVATLLRLGLATETPIDGRISLEAISCSKAHNSLKERWNSLLG